MPKIFDIELNTTFITLRIIVGIIIAALTFYVFYYLPMNLANILGTFIPTQILPPSSTLGPILSTIVNPTLPIIGLLLTILVFMEYLFWGSKAYGPILMLTALSFAAYLYLLFNGGITTITIPANLLNGTSIDITLDLTVIMLLTMLPSILNIMKGIVLITKKNS